MYQVLEASDVPHGTINIAMGDREELAKTLAERDDVDAVWFAGAAEDAMATKRVSAGNMTRTWVLPASGLLPEQGEVL